MRKSIYNQVYTPSQSDSESKRKPKDSEEPKPRRSKRKLEVAHSDDDWKPSEKSQKKIKTEQPKKQTVSYVRNFQFFISPLII